MDVPIDFTDCQCKWDDNCWVQGRGTSKAIRGCRAHFDVHLIDKSQLINLTVEIKGPENTICFEKIKQSANQSHPLRGSNFKGSPFQLGGPKGDAKGDSTLIPMWYSTIPGKISIYYIPLVIGIHKIRLFNRYAQIRGSPFTVAVQQDDHFHGLTNRSTNCSLARSVTFCETVSNISSQKMNDNHSLQIVATMDKNHLSLPASSSIEIRRSKSSELLTSKSPVETIESPWDRPSVSGTEAHLFKTSKDHISVSSSSSSSIADSNVDEDEEDDDDDEDDKEDQNDHEGEEDDDLTIDLTLSDYLKRCTKCFHNLRQSESNNLLLAESDYLIKAMNQRYQEEHFKEHSFRVKSLIEYWNKMSLSSIPCSPEQKCKSCAESEND